MERISIVIPALNEEKTIINVINELKKSEYISEIIVVDNNSSDNTAKLSKENSAKVIFCKEIGYGYALKKGILEAKNRLVFKIDADIKNVDYKWIELLYKNMVNEQSSLVKTYWENEKDPMPVTNLVAKPLLKYHYSSLSDIKMPISGIYLFNKSLLNIEHMQNTFALDLDILISIKKLGYKISQVSLGKVYDNLKPISNYSNMSYELISFINIKKNYDKSVLFFLAHPDDAEIWCGGLISKYSLNHSKIIIVIATSNKIRKEESLRIKTIFPEIEIVFMNNIELSNFYNRKNIDTLHDIVKKNQPDIFITHHKDDIHIDHKLCFDITSSVFLKLDRDLLPKKFLMCNSYFQDNHNIFNPNIYIDISMVMDIKLKLIDNFISQDTEYWKNMIIKIDSLNGLKSSVKYAEAFEEYQFYTINRATETI
ncbi:glycosyltransferase [Poseidonibacter lekithochrous]|uniref:glycosyltransferase n=1 Tax=Poseidonibacter lekithochrous TaxID=1904463 RepID=UPI000D36870E|nr:glycosyltransferase [Poseidonibacter lekithochrous]